MFVNNMPAYTISNENQRWATQLVPDVKSVLTVAGSGDQALFYKLSGAKIIDTFDITCNARVIQDIKITMIKHLKPDEYKDLLIKLHNKDGDALISCLHDLWQFLPEETHEIITNNKNNLILGCGLNASFYPKNIPTETEYADLKKMLSKPFNFIWSDLESLSANITRKYDLINISNIFDYIPNGQTQIKILKDLSKHLKHNGRIIYLPQRQRFGYKKVNLPHLIYEKTLKDENSRNVIFFQRIR